jgi:large subunit ribosomal protein L10
MALKLQQKKAIVDAMRTTVSSALSVVAVDYRGLTSVQMTNLRAKAREMRGVRLKIVPNTLARRAFTGTTFECMLASLKGPVLLAFSNEELGATARLLRDFAKDNDKLEILALSLGDTVLDKSQVNAVASLPSRDEALAKLLSVMQAPIAKLVRTMAEPQAKFVRLLAAVRDKKQAEGN